jgi:hypothetical protein
MDSIPQEIRQIILTQVGPASARMYGETCQEAKDFVTKHVRYATNQTLCQLASRSNDLALLKYAREINIPWNGNVFVEAAKNGNLAIIEYAQANGCPWHHNASYEAAARGYLDIIKFSHSQGHRLYPTLSDVSARHGKLEVFKFLYENTLSCNQYAARIAARTGRLNILEFLYENDQLWKGLDLCYSASICGDNGVVSNWLVKIAACRCGGIYHN